MPSEYLISKIAAQLNLAEGQINAVITLSNEGCTIPFISRYRKDKTGNLNEVTVNEILEVYAKSEKLEKRRSFILKYLDDNSKLTKELKDKILKAETLTLLEDIYLPYKPRKKTLADRAIELGLEPLAVLIKSKNLNKNDGLRESLKFINDEVKDAQTALDYALNIIIQEISDSSSVRQEVRKFLSRGEVESSVKKGKKKEGIKYKDYYDFAENISKIPSHRVMAIFRGEKDGILNLIVSPVLEEDIIIQRITKIHFKKTGELLLQSTGESYKRHLLKSLGRDLLKEIHMRAEIDSLEIFSKNLEKILLSPPFGEKPIIGIDPGIKTGCKSVVINGNGDFLESATIYLHKNSNDAVKLIEWVEKYNVKGIAIGSGTFGREAFKIINKLFNNSGIVIALVDEDGASIYSAGKTAREEFPDLDLTVRGAISIGRRFQDPMAELVKLNPESMGVGQYQHDIKTSLLKDKLTKTVEWAVNKTGINLNTASYHLLGYISGLDKNKAKEIAKYRNNKNKITSIMELKKIKGIGEKAFEQSSGFLRIRDGINILDSTGVHPESYENVEKISLLFKTSLEDIVNNPDLINRAQIDSKLSIEGIDSIINELKQRGLDPREKYEPVAFCDDIETIEDLSVGQVLNGIVDNVVAFGAFIDLGIKDKALVHISEISIDYVDNINNAISVGDEVTVKVIGIEMERRRISLSMKGIVHTP